MENKIISQAKRKKRRIEVLHKERLTEAIKKENDPSLKLKLSVLNNMATFDMRPREVAELFGLSFKTVYLWLWAWNKEGLEGLGKIYLTHQENLQS